MILRITILRPEAEADLQATYDWYQSQRSGLGEDFLLAFEAAIGAVQRLPESYPKVHRNIRRALLRRFPYGLFFILKEDRIVVLAVMHARRHPQRWQGRK